MTSWHSYAKIWNIGHGALAELFDDEVIVEEKVDGSQFSFGVFNGELKCRSKGQQLIVDAPEALFKDAVDVVKSIQHLLKDGYTYRGEYLKKPKHNALAYDRIPNKNIIIFDISPAEEVYLSYEEKATEATRLGLEVVPLVSKGIIKDANVFLDLMNTVSILGGQKVEGVVVKNYKKFGPDKKVLLGKYVSETFKEVHKNDWAKSNPKQGDVLTLLCEQFRTKARWNKAIQHLEERGLLTDTPKDIAILIKEVQSDVETECLDEIVKQLVTWAMPHIKRKAIAGLPEWYKEKLVKKQFSKETDELPKLLF